MSEATGGRKPRTTPPAEENIVDAEVVETPAAAPSTPAAATPEKVEVIETTPAPAQVIYVQTPAPPTRKGNRGVGALVVLASAVVFTALLALVAGIVSAVATGRASFTFLAAPQFYLPTLFFVIAFVIVVLIANRAAWWAYILGSIVVGLVVYFGTIGALLLVGGVILMTPAEAAEQFRIGLTDPTIIAAALLAREVALWTGSIIARRGRRVKERNVQARQAWEREVAEKRAEYERAASGAATAV